MREIKFRAWDKWHTRCEDDPSSMVEETHRVMIKLNGDVYNSEYGDNQNDRYIIMQYTGLKDKNGIEIYEGDILKWENQERPSGISDYRQDQRFVIKYDISYFLAENIKYNEQSKYYGSRYLHNLFYPLQDKIELIGNIYENPELLK